MVKIIGCWCNVTLKKVKERTCFCWHGELRTILFKRKLQTPLSSLSPNLSIKALKQTSGKHKHRSARKHLPSQLQGWITALESSPFRGQLSRDFQNKLECYFPWGNPLKPMEGLLLEIPVGLKFYFQCLSFENIKWFSCSCVILYWKQGMDDLRTGLSSPDTKYSLSFKHKAWRKTYYCSAVKMSNLIDLRRGQWSSPIQFLDLTSFF